MSLSISSSSRVRLLLPEAKVLLFVAFVLVLGEAGMRLTLGRMSLDMRHLDEIPRVADAIRHDRSKTVLFLGNSLTRHGVDLDVIRPLLGVDAHAYAVYPDDTTLLDWHYTFERFFVDAGSKPDIVVIGYAHVMLNDGAPAHPERIARYAGLKYAPELFANDLAGAGPKVDYLLSAASVTFAEGSRVRLMLLDRLIPGYRATSQLLNTTARRQLEARSSGSLGRLSRFLAMCRANRVLPVFVAMPVLEPYTVDPRLPAAIAAGGGVFVDMRSVAGIDKTRYLDGLHLDPRGAALYSSALAPRLTAMLRQQAAAATVPAAREQTPPLRAGRRSRSPS